MKNKGFTLVEVLVVIGIIAVLAIVVTYTLNPSQFFAQGRDANRVVAMSSLDKAISLYYSNAINTPSTLFMGTSSVIYVSIPDPTATTTAGTNCAALGLPSVTGYTYTGYTYHCAASSTYLDNNGTGWIPINFTNYPGGSALSALPVDPVNTTSSGEYYVYLTDGTGGYEVMANPQSVKDAPDTSDFVKGTNLALETTFPGGGTGGSGGTVTFTTSTVGALDGGILGGLAFDSHTNSIWGANANGASNVIQINDTTPYASSTHSVSNWPEGSVFDSYTNTIWVTDGGDGTAVTQINDTTPYASNAVNLGRCQGLSTNPGYITFDSHTNTLWTADENCSGVTQINDTTPYATSTYILGNGLGVLGITFDSHTNTIWVADNGTNSVTKINDTTPYASSTYSVGSEPKGIVFDPHTNSIWVANDNSDTVTQINDTTYAKSTYSVGVSPSDITFDSYTDSIWVDNTFGNSVTQINDTTPYASTTYSVNSPSDIGFDSHTNTIWVSSYDNNDITLFTP